MWKATLTVLSNKSFRWCGFNMRAFIVILPPKWMSDAYGSFKSSMLAVSIMSKYFNLAFSVNAFPLFDGIRFGWFACIDADNMVFLLCSVRLKVSGCVFLPLKTATAATSKYVCIRGLHLHLFKLICISICNPTQHSSIIQNVYLKSHLGVFAFVLNHHK